MVSDQYEYDVFISYAIEDKISVVNELVHKLEESGIKVWYASQKLRVGYGVQETIKEGLNRSRHGILILSHNFFAKEWPKKELHVWWSREDALERKILPVWHNITEDEIKSYDPLLANTYGLDTLKGVDHVVRKLINSIIVKPQQENSEPAPQFRNYKLLLGIGIFIILLSLGLYFYQAKETSADPEIIQLPDNTNNVNYIIVLPPEFDESEIFQLHNTGNGNQIIPADMQEINHLINSASNQRKYRNSTKSKKGYWLYIPSE
ncbi:MAG: toll/interleukin-1 receptor domain-containing protein [Candidatus Cyclobacteriaceae bacterium M2_1C_046]